LYQSARDRPSPRRAPGGDLLVNEQVCFQKKQFGSNQGEGNKSIRDQAMALALALKNSARVEKCVDP